MKVIKYIPRAMKSPNQNIKNTVAKKANTKNPQVSPRPTKIQSRLLTPSYTSSMSP